MKEVFDRIREKYANVKTELLLMLLFICFFILIAGKDIVRETAALQPQTELQMEAVTESETEAETESETEAQTEDPKEQERRERNALAKLDSAFGIPMQMPEQKETDLLYYTQLENTWLLPEYHMPEKKRQERVFTELESQLEQKLAEYDGSWSVYVKKLSTGESFVINDQPMKSASVMKLFIMGTVYKAFESGEMERTDEVMSLMNDMISYSDNEASNELLYRLGNGSYEAGIEQVDAFIREYGFSEMTVEYNGFNNSETVTDESQSNQVSAKDCGKILEDIYRRTWVSRSISNEMEAMLLAQHTRYKIPAGIPEGVLCGNKTGEMDTTENDAAIVYGEDCDYILVVLSSEWSSKDQAITRIQSVSKDVYEYLNG